MPVKKLKEFLDSNGVKYMTINHSIAYTAQEIAASACIPGKELAKTVILKVDGKMVMAVLSASEKIDFELLKKSFVTSKITLATENEFQSMFPECDIGAMPPFGNLYGLSVYVDPMLSEHGVIAFNAGTHTELIEMSYADFDSLVHPHVLEAVSE